MGLVTESTCIVLSTLLILSRVRSDRIAPGVNPQMYQQTGQQNFHNQPPPPPQGGQPVQGYGQPNLQQGGQQFVPTPQQPQFQQQQQQQQQHQQHQQHHVPHGPVHGHVPMDRKPVLDATNIQHEREHIQEHMDIPLDTSKMSESELQFHYFKMHDADNNNKLDGCELIKSLIHWHEQGHDNQAAGELPGGAKPQPKLFVDEELMQLIDPILKMDDRNQDGYIDYTEFIQAQQKSAVR